MCEIITKWGASEWAGIIQALVALASAYLLYKTLNSQKEATATSKAVAEIDRKAKRAEYLPEITNSLRVLPPVKSLADGSYVSDAFNGENTVIEVKIKFTKNPVQILDFDYLKTEKYIQMDIYPFPFDPNKILMPGEFFELKYNINLLNHFGLVNENNDPDFSLSVEANGIDYRNQIFLHNKLIFADILGNKYELKFNIIGLEKLDQYQLTMIE